MELFALIEDARISEDRELFHRLQDEQRGLSQAIEQAYANTKGPRPMGLGLHKGY
jgi:hypothetical protein